MSIEILIEGTQATIKPLENLQASLVGEMREKLKALLGEGIREFIFDIATVTVIDSLGIGLLIMCHNSLKNMGGRMEVVNTTQSLMDEFRLMRLDRHFKISSQARTDEG